MYKLELYGDINTYSLSSILDLFRIIYKREENTVKDWQLLFSILVLLLVIQVVYILMQKSHRG